MQVVEVRQTYIFAPIDGFAHECVPSLFLPLTALPNAATWKLNEPRPKIQRTTKNRHSSSALEHYD
jgi:hypothetical protein